jgi:enoyl-CoA hydratase/carnithine racemase
LTGDEDTSLPVELLSSLDVLVATEQEAQPLIRNIRKTPLAAMILVQLLRHSEGASIQDGLFAESLAYATLQGGSEFQNWLANRKPETVVDSNCHEPAVLADLRGNELYLTLNRPDSRNAFSVEMRDELVEGLMLLASDPSIERAIISAVGPCFCTGGDLREFGSFDNTARAHAVRSTRNAGKLISSMADRIECRVHRACLGSGVELPAFCGRIVATEDTFFRLPEVNLGLIPGAGGTISIPRRIGRQRTAWLGLSAKKINARTALEWGLIDAIEGEE